MNKPSSARAVARRAKERNLRASRRNRTLFLEEVESRILLATYVVTDLTGLATDPNSLAGAIFLVNHDGLTGDIINFAAAGDYQVGSDVSPLNNSVTINAAALAGVTISPAATLPATVGLQFAIGSDNSKVNDVTISGFTTAGVEINGAPGVLVTGSQINAAANSTGVLIGSVTTGASITSTTIVGGAFGVQIASAASNTVGAGTAISGASTAGVDIIGAPSVSNAVNGATIGNSGTAGVLVETGASKTSITTATISGSKFGVQFNGTAQNTVGAGTVITAGTIAGVDITGAGATLDVVNGASITAGLVTGILIESGASQASIVASTITGGGIGVQISGATKNTVGASTVTGAVSAGVDITGAASTQNSVSGASITGGTAASGVLIEVGASNNSISSSAISGGAFGVLISDASTNTVGTGTAITSATVAGIGITGTTSAANSVGGAVISAGTVTGVVVEGGATSTTIAGASISGGAIGVQFNGAIGNTVGAGTTINGATTAGVDITGGGSAGDFVNGGLITPATGGIGVLVESGASSASISGVSISGGAFGVQFNGTASNTVGAGTTITGATTAGVDITGTASTGNLVSSVTINATDADGVKIEQGATLVTITGSTIIGAGSAGIGIDISASTVGGTVTQNILISGNTIDLNPAGGVSITNSSKVVLTGNLIGTDASGNAEGNGGTGVLISGSPDNTIGGSGAGNVISGNNGPGISIGGVTSSGNVIEANKIGTKADGITALANTGAGIAISTGAGGNVVGNPSPTVGAQNGADALGNLIAFNTGPGIDETGAGALNVVFSNGIHDNQAGEGIFPLTTAPALTAALNFQNDYRIDGSIPGATLGQRFLIQVFNNAASNTPDGRALLGTFVAFTTATGQLTADPTGLTVKNVYLSKPTGGIDVAGLHLTVTATQVDATNVPQTSTTAFGVRLAVEALVVTTTNDTIAVDSGSLRAAILNADDHVNSPFYVVGSTDLISFAITPPASVYVITVASVLPTITAPVLIDGTTATNGSLPATVQVTGSGQLADGFHIFKGAGGDASRTTIRAITINGFTTGVEVDGASSVSLSGLTIASSGVGSAGILVDNGATGVSITGSTISGGAFGVQFLGAASNTVSGNSSILGASTAGVDISGATSTADIVTNVQISVGIGAAGMLVENGAAGASITASSISGGAFGVQFNGVANNLVGAGTTITGASSAAVDISGLASTGDTVTGTQIHVNGDGVLIELGATLATISGSTISGTGTTGFGIHIDASTVAGPVTQNDLITGNTIDSNQSGGVAILNGSNKVVLTGNFIGTDAAGDLGLGNQVAGVLIGDTTVGSSNNTIGGNIAGSANIIAGNIGPGISIANVTSLGTLIEGNFIGTDAAGDIGLGNQGAGILITGVPSTTIGGSATADRNVISGNAGPGISITGGTALNNAIQGNFIGTKPDGTTALANTGAGIVIGAGAGGNVVGNPAPTVGFQIGTDALGNVIAFNGSFGIDETGAGALNVVFSNSIHDNDNPAGEGIFPLTTAPALTAVLNFQNDYRIDGSIPGATLGQRFLIQVFNNAASNTPDGRTLLGTFVAFTTATGQLTADPTGLTLKNVYLLKPPGGLVVAGLDLSVTATQVNATNVALTSTTAFGVHQGVEALLVTTTTDSAAADSGSLRATILNANDHNNAANTGQAPDTITFGLPPSAAIYTFTLTSQLPDITDALIIDGSTSLNAGVVDIVVASADGIHFVAGSDGSKLINLSFDGFTSAGVDIDGASQVTISGGQITSTAGADGILIHNGASLASITGASISGGAFGVEIIGASNNSVATGTTISGASTAGVDINGAASTGNKVTGATITASATGVGVSIENGASGASISGTTISGGAFGVLISGAASNTVGAGTSISGASTAGIDINGAASTGDSVAGVTISAPVGGIGIRIETNATTNSITGDIISGGSFGVQFLGAPSNTVGAGTSISGATIAGIDINGAASTGDIVNGVQINATTGAVGVLIENGASTAAITGSTFSGGAFGVQINGAASITVGAGTSISGASTAGVDITGAASTGDNVTGVQINAPAGAIGVLVQGAASVASITGSSISGGAFGIQFLNSGNNTIGAGTTISAATTAGVDINGATSTNDVVTSTQVTAAAGAIGILIENGASADSITAATLTGGAFGVQFLGASNNTVGAGTTISGATTAGVDINGATSTGDVVNGVQITATAGDVGVLIENAASTAAITASTISGGAFGVQINGAASNTVGVGTSITGATTAGVDITGAASTGNTVTNVQLTSPAGAVGVRVESAASGTSVTNDTITGGAFGVQFLGASSNTVGAGTTISGATTAGVDINGAASTGNIVNSVQVINPATSIGVLVENTASGASIIASTISGGVFGVQFNNAPNNTVSGLTSITGATTAGVDITGAASTGDVVSNVQINANGGDGVRIELGATLASITGSTISGNGGGAAGFGIRIDGSTVPAAVLQNDLVSGNTVTLNQAGGIAILNGSNKVLVTGNFIGTNAASNTGLGNLGGAGVLISGSPNNTIGGAGVLGNVISGNAGNGVSITGASPGTLLEGNEIGTNLAGTAALPNLGDGILVQADSVTIGGDNLGNVISGNNGPGIVIAAGGTNATILGNFIGTSSAGLALTSGASGGDGILVGAAFAVIGDGTTAGRNIISANVGDGIDLTSGGTGALIVGNFIGTTGTGSAALANLGDGVLIGANSVTLGSATSGGGNLISGNKLDGVLINASASLVLGNLIGTDVTGLLAIPNLLNGVHISTAAAILNTIGGSTAGSRNLISGNTLDGVLIDNAAAQNIIAGNFIGTKATGTTALANLANGVELNGAASNTVGGTITGTANVISGNTLDGVLIDGASTQNVVAGNFIGLNATGTSALPNSKNGVHITGATATANSINGGNVISGNTLDGILFDFGASGNVVAANRIGTDSTGLIAVANQTAGLELNGAIANTIGGPSARNTISGNTGDGILIDGNSTQNFIAANSIGLNAPGTSALANTKNGVHITGPGATANTIFGSFISGNSLDGVLIDLGASLNVVKGNAIGTNSSETAAVPNGSNGVELNGANSNSIGTTFTGDSISGNNGDGVLIDGASTQNVIADNFIGLIAGGDGTFANTKNGVHITGAAAISNSISGNFISGNRLDGVLIDLAASRNVVGGNSIGLTENGFAAPNGSNGVEVSGAGFNSIGMAGASNTISGNTGDGVLIDGASTKNVVAANLIGQTNIAAVANVKNGVHITGASATGNTINDGNVISGNTLDGVLIDLGSSLNVVAGNLIGTNLFGTAAVANGLNGIELNGVISNTVGGASAAAGNTISGNLGDGVLIDGASTQNIVAANFIGLNAAGSAALANLKNGVHINGAAATANSINGGNVISGNTLDGILIDLGSTKNVVAANFIGTNSTGLVAVGNLANGVEINSANANTIGGATAAAGNVIGGNGGVGVLIDGSSDANLVTSNFIGTNLTKTAKLGNGGPGIEVNLSSTIANAVGNTINGNIVQNNAIGILLSGSSTRGVLVANPTIIASTGNLIGVEIENHAHDNTVSGVLIQGFSQDGILITSGANNNSIISCTVTGNAEGIRIDNASGNSIIGSVRSPGEITGNQGVGVHVTNGATNNLIDHEIIGGAAAGTQGLTGNLGDGVLIDAGATLTTVSNNTIGFNLVNPNVSGSGNGVHILNSSVTSSVNNLIVANTIIANATAGVSLNSTNDNILMNNFVGIDSAMTSGLGNANQGIVLTNAASNTIGGSSGKAGNLIANNGLSGIEIGGANSSGNAVQGNAITGNGVGIALVTAGVANVIGINAIGSNKGDGVFLFQTSQAMIVGNAIASNGTAVAGFGVHTQNSSNDLVSANTIQMNAAGGVGIVSSTTITVAGNTISKNTHADGVLISGGSTNAVTNNTIAGNGGFGIDVAGSSVTTAGHANNSIAGNTVTGNQSGGIGLLSGTNNTILTSNRIGLPGAGNASFGVVIDGAAGNTVGSGNVIAANAAGGIALKNSTTTGNVVLGSFIGTDASGKAGLGNAGTGVLILNAPGNIVGYTVIAANQGFGIEINGAGASKNNVVFNIIGTTNALATGMGNALEGIRVTGAPNAALVSNLVTANKLSGVDLVGASGTLVSANLIGSVPSAGVPGNAAAGLFLNGSTGSFVGLNTLSGNAGDGIAVAGGSTSNTIAFNGIGAFGGGAANLGNGVQLNNASSTTLMGNSILGNAVYGVLIDNFSRANSLSGNVVNGNALVGIELFQTSGNTVGGTAASALNAVNGNVVGLQIFESSSNVVGNNSITQNLSAGVAIVGAQSQGNVLTSNNILVNANASGDAVMIVSGATANTLSSNTLMSTNASPGYGLAIDGSVAESGVNAGRNNVSGNTITGFKAGGVLLNNTSGNTLTSGNSIVGNAGDGVAIVGTSTSNTLGGNIISGNTGVASGVHIVGMSATGNMLFGNRIGLDANGVQLPNAQFGVFLQNTTGNDVGSFGSPGATNPGVIAGVPQNIIAGNHNDDVRIAGGGFNVVQNNFLGTNALGQALGGPVQAVNGVTVRFSNGNVITHNVISGHGSPLFRNAGVLIDTDLQANSQVDAPLGENVGTTLASVNNNVSFNLIGTDPTGTTTTVAATALNAGLQNTQGVVISGASSTMVDHNVIGGSIEVGIQVFNAAGSTRNGQTISTNATTNNTIINNLIGVTGGGNSTGAANGGGIFLNDSNGTTVGGAAGSANTISGNTGSAVQLLGRASKNTVLSNIITGNVVGIFLNGVVQTSKIQVPNSGSNPGGDLIIRQVQSGPFVDNSSINAQGTVVQITFGQYVDETRVLDPTLYHIQALASPSGIAGSVPFTVGGYNEETRTVTLVLGETLSPLTTNFQVTIGLGSQGGLTNRVTTAASTGFDGDTQTARFVLDGNFDGAPGGQYLASHRTNDAANADTSFSLNPAVAGLQTVNASGMVVTAAAVPASSPVKTAAGGGQSAKAPAVMPNSNKLQSPLPPTQSDHGTLVDAAIQFGIGTTRQRSAKGAKG